MARNRVLSFITQFSNRDSRSSTPSSPIQTSGTSRFETKEDVYTHEPKISPIQQQFVAETRDLPQVRPNREWSEGDRVSSRPLSMVQTYQPPLMELNQDTLPELQPIFTFLNSHGNKLYQEGYFLKLDDQNSQGKPNADRTWTECFAQLVGTVLSLWDAAELDAAGQDGEVLPKFINLTDASIKMIDPLPTRSNEPPLQNVLSISTAGKNRYLFHFNSHHSLIQWTAGIRLAMYEHTTLQEAYTGALIAGKGKTLNNIQLIMSRSKVPTEDWVRVRFGAGTPWRRCWCVITPPDEKQAQKLEKELNKKKSAYDRSRPPILKGDVKFYDTKKTKKARPIASISDAYSAYAIYPQSKPLIDASTLMKVEGIITIHANPPSSTEGFVFVMPEIRPAVSGFEMMLRWLFPVMDTFGLYGRPKRLVADTLDQRSLMFALPKERRYGYLETLDVTGLILTNGSQAWQEMEWRRRLKELTAKRMLAIADGSRSNSRYSSRRNTRNSFAGAAARSQPDLNDRASIRSQPSRVSWTQGPPETTFGGIPRTDSSPAGVDTLQDPQHHKPTQRHRSASESQGLDRYQNQDSLGYDGGLEDGPPPPPHLNTGFAAFPQASNMKYQNGMTGTPERVSSEDEAAAVRTPVRELQDLQAPSRVEPVAVPPAFSHAPGSLPVSKPYHSPELRRANSRMSHATLAQMGADGITPPTFNLGDEHTRTSGDHTRGYGGESDDRGVLSNANTSGIIANHKFLTEGLVAASRTDHYSSERPSSRDRIPPPIDQPYQRTHQNSQFRPDLNSSETNYSQLNTLTAHQTRTDGSFPLNTTYASSDVEPINSPNSASALKYNGDVHTSSVDFTTSQPSRSLNRYSVSRKPLPMQTSGFSNVNTGPPTATSSSGSPDHQVIDQEGFDRVIPRNLINKSMLQAPTPPLRQLSNSSSVYDDASSHPPQSDSNLLTETRRSVDRPRAGVLRTVGNEQVFSTVGPEDSALDIDFGPTLNYAALPRESSPARQNRLSQVPDPQQHARSSSRNMVGSETYHSRNRSTPEHGQYRPDPNASPSRTVQWQPGMSALSNTTPGKRALTPEQFVQQRAAVVNPIYAHGRQQSINTSRPRTATPPLFRNQSSEFLSHSRNNSSDILQRPSSRGGSAAFGSGGDFSTNLTAKEQESFVRTTGAALVNMPVVNKIPPPTGGLIGTIDVREREKREFKQGINSQAVQHALYQRQQQAQSQQVQAQAGMRSQSPAPSRAHPERYGPGYAQQSPAGTPTGYQQYPYQPPPRQQQWGQPSPMGTSPSSSWAPGQQGTVNPEQGQQQQYFPQHQGRGQPHFQGRG